MKKIFSIVLILALTFTLYVPVMAEGGTITILSATGTTSSVTFSATASSGVLAIMTEILSGSTSVARHSFGISANGSFSGTITGVRLSAGTTYTLRAADYEGGDWAVTTFTVPSGSSDEDDDDTPGAPTTSVTPPAPVINKPVTQSGVTTVTIEVEPTVSGNTAIASITFNTVNNAVESALQQAAGNNTAPVVEINIDTADKATEVKTEIPTASIEKIAQSETNAALTISTGIGSITLDSDALSAVAGQAGEDITISIAQVDASALSQAQQTIVGDNMVIDLSITSADTAISSFEGGTATVVIPYKLKEGESAEGVVIYFLSDDGELIPVEGSFNPETGLVSFTTGHFSKYVIAYDVIAAWKNPFTDVLKNAWYYDNVAFANMKGLFGGTTTTTFEPATLMDRAMMVTVLWRLEGKPVVAGDNPFADAENGAWYTDAVIWAAENKIVEGYGNGRFGPRDNVTREQMAAIMYRYADYKGCGVTATADLSKFTDSGKISSYALPALSWANASGLVTGKGGGILDPGGNARRSETAAIVHRFCGLEAESEK